MLCLCVTPPRTCCGCSGTQERLTPGLLACCRATCSVVNPLTSCTLFPPSPPRRRRRPGSGCGRSYVLIHSSDEHASACQGRGGHCQQWCVMQYSNLCLAVGPLCGLCGWLPSVTQHIPLDCPIINASQVRARQVWSNRSRPRHCRPGSSHSRSQPVSGRTTRSGLRHRRGSASPCCDCGHSSHSPTLSPYDMSCTAHCATVLRRHRTPPRCPYDRRRAVEVLLLSSNFSLAPHARARARSLCWCPPIGPLYPSLPRRYLHQTNSRFDELVRASPVPKVPNHNNCFIHMHRATRLRNRRSRFTSHHPPPPHTHTHLASRGRTQFLGGGGSGGMDGGPMSALPSASTTPNGSTTVFKRPGLPLRTTPSRYVAIPVAI